MNFVKELERLFDQAKDAVIVRTVDGKIASWNRCATELYGWEKEEAVGKISHELLRTNFPKPLKEIESEVIQNGVWEGNLVHSTRDQNRVSVKSRWVMNQEGEPVVFEINAPTPDPEPARGNPVVAKAKDGIGPKIANILLASGAGLCFLVVLYFIYVYAWTQKLQFMTPMHAALYYIFPTALTVFLIHSIGFKNAAKSNLILFGGSLLISLYGVEVFLICLLPRDNSYIEAVDPLWRLSVARDKEKEAEELSRKFGMKIDTRTQTHVIADFAKNGVEAVPRTTTASLLFDLPNGNIESSLKVNGQEVLPLAGVANKATILCNESGTWIDYRSDEQGFNNPNGLWKSPTIEIAALGDSFTHGYCVSGHQNFVGVLRQTYPATLNLGITGDGPLLMLAKINEYLKSRKPRIVLWFYYEGNDLGDLKIERKSTLLMKYLNDGFTQSELARQSVIDRVLMDNLATPTAANRRNPDNEWSIDGLVEFIKLGSLRQKLRLSAGEDPESINERTDFNGVNMYVFGEILKKAKERVEGWGGQFYAVYLPEWSRYSGYHSGGIAKRDDILRIARNLKIPVIDVVPAFNSHGDPLSLFPLRGAAHYNEAGHRLVAETVVKGLSEAGFNP